MPIFVGSNSDDSRIRSDRVGLAVSTANPGSASEGDVYFNSSDSGLRAYDGSGWSAVGAGGGSFSGIASGTLANGQTVVITTDGKISGITSTGIGLTSGEPKNLGPLNEQISGNSVAYDESQKKLFVVYQSTDNSDRPYGVVGTITGTGITFGTPQRIRTSRIYYAPSVVYHPPTKNIVFAFHSSSGIYGYTASIKDDTFTLGAEGSYLQQTSGIYFIKLMYHKQTENIVMLNLNQPSTNPGFWGQVLKIDADVVTPMGAVRASTSGNTLSNERFGATYIESDGRVVGFWRDQTAGYQSFQSIGTISGTSLTWGTQQSGPGASENIHLVYDHPSGNILVPLAHNNKIKYRVGIVTAGDDYIQYTALAEPSSNQPSDGSPTYLQATFDPIEKKYLFTYRQRDSNSNYYQGLTQGTFNGTTLTLDSSIQTQIFSGNPNYPSSTYVSDEKLNVNIVGVSTGALAHTLQSARTTSNLTSDNFLGFSDAAYSDGQTATVQIAGSVDDAQSNLTTGSRHFVNRVGTLTTIADSPSVVGGFAISATKIIVKK